MLSVFKRNSGTHAKANLRPQKWLGGRPLHIHMKAPFSEP